MTAVGARPHSVAELAQPRAAGAEGLRPEDRHAFCRDLLQPYVDDYSCFTRAIAAEAVRYWGRPRMLDFGCGTGTVALPILAGARDLDYMGFDPSEPMVRLFRRKTAKVERARRVIQLTAPVDPRRRDVPVSLYGGTAEMVLAADFLQYVPLAAPSDDWYGRVGMLNMLRGLLRPGGRMFIIEDVLGESSEEEAQFDCLWNQSMVTRVRPVFESHLAPLLGQLDPELSDLVCRMPRQPALARVVRERIRREPQGQRLPFDAWARLFEHLGWQYTVMRHVELGNLYLFTIQA